MLNVNLSGSLPVVSCSSPASVCNYIREAGNALVLTETASETIINSVVNDCNFRDKQDVLDTFHFAGLIDSPCVNPVSIYNRLKADIKSGKRAESDCSTITFTYIREKTKYESVIEYPVFLVLFRLYNRLKKREADMKARQDEALSNVKSLHDAYILGKATAEQLGEAIEKADRLMVQDASVNEARKTLVHKTILRRKNASYQELIVMAGDMLLNADVYHADMLLCLSRQKSKKASRPAPQSYKQKRIDRAKAFYASLEKMKQDCLSYKLQQEKEKREALSAKMAADSALLQAMAFDYNSIRDILQSIPPDGKAIKKDDLMKKINHIRQLVCGK